MLLTKDKIKKIKTLEKSLQRNLNSKEFKKIIKEKPKLSFDFEMFLKKKTNLYIVTFKGRHYSKNVIQTWHRGILLKYKKAIKIAAKKAFLKESAKAQDKINITPLEQVEIDTKVYNPISRDDDANYDTLKYMRDTLTTNGLIKDDNRNVILKTNEEEIISKDWKIEFYITIVA